MNKNELELEELGYHPPTWTKKQQREYKRKRKATRKELLKQAKNYQPWDYGYLLKAIDTMLTDMEEYYSTGTNVVQVDESRLEVVDQLKEVRAKLQEYYDADDVLDIEAPKKLEEFFSLMGKYFLYWWD